MKGIQLRDKFFAGNLAARSTANARGALSAAAPKDDSIMCRCLHGVVAAAKLTHVPEFC